jgi:Spy/CpxP family protein refolding chaperone
MKEQQMKKIFVVAVITLSSVALLAQGPPQRKMAGPGEGAPHNRQEKLMEFLQLTAEQKSAWQAVHDESRESLEAVASRQREAHEQMGAALEAANPDACAVGRFMIQVDAAGDERRALQEATTKKASALLTAEQKTRFEAWKAAQHEEGMKMRTPQR